MQTDPKKTGSFSLLEQDIAEVMREQTARLDPDEGLERFMAAVAANPKRSSMDASWWQRINDWLSGVGLTPAFASLVIVAQAGVLFVLMASQPGSDDVDLTTQYRGAGVQQQQVPDFKLTISPDADFAGLASLLHSNGCKIIAGPSESGEIWVVLDDKRRLDEVRATLSQSIMIDDVASLQKQAIGH